MFVIIGEKTRAASSLATDLCMSCEHFQVVRYSRNETEQRLCHYNGHMRPLHGPVASCNLYGDKNQPSKWDMEKIAWTIEASKKKVGFGAEIEVHINPPKKKKGSSILDD